MTCKNGHQIKERNLLVLLIYFFNIIIFNNIYIFLYNVALTTLYDYICIGNRCEKKKWLIDGD